MRKFLLDEAGQDLIEYTLLLAFIALSGAAAYLGISNSLTGLWTTANSRLAAANTTGN
jgi:Flp pilus assembly pilin Flp